MTLSNAAKTLEEMHARKAGGPGAGLRLASAVIGDKQSEGKCWEVMSRRPWAPPSTRQLGLMKNPRAGNWELGPHHDY